MRQGKTRPDIADSIPADFGLVDDSTVVAAVVIDAKQRVLAANARLHSLLGNRDIVGTLFTDLIGDSAERAGWERAVASGTGSSLTLRLPANGRPVTLRGDLRSTGCRDAPRFVGIFVDVDVDEREQMRTLLQRGSRVEALGSLTAGIAHDFNNLLTVLVGNLYLLAEEVRAEPKRFEKIKAARDAAKRGADLIRQLLAFARREELPSELVDVSKLVSSLAPLLERALGKRVTLELDMDERLGSIRASAAQLESAIVNLAVNARDAIARRGTVRIGARATQLSGDEAARRRLAPGAYIDLHVADDGVGIAPEALPEVFEPFFSTKREQGGTGLGLSMVRWFAEHAGGRAEIESAPGRGTTVRLWLPISGRSASDTLDKTMPLSTLPVGTEKIVAIAAEDGLRATIQQILEVLGYTVEFVTGSQAAVAALENGDLLLLDASGIDEDQQAQTAAAALASKPAVPVVLLTDARAGRRTIPGVQTLIKPFSLADLAGIVRAALDAPRED